MDRLKAGAAGGLVVLTIALAVSVLTKDSAIGADQTTEKTAVITMAAVNGQKEPENPLEKNRDPKLNELVRSYYKKVASGDLEGLREITENMGENFQQEVANNPKFMEEYQNIEVYTKKADMEGDFIVFVYYEMKIRDIETPVPGLGNLYVTRKEDGHYIVGNGMYDSKVQEYIQRVASDEDVQALVAEVQQKYRRAKESDETLRLAIDDLSSVYSE